MLLLLPAVSTGIVLLFARGANRGALGNLILLAIGLVVVETTRFEGTVDDTASLGIDTGLVEGNTNISEGPGKARVAIPNAAELARLVIFLASKADRKSLFREGEAHRLLETGNSHYESVAGASQFHRRGRDGHGHEGTGGGQVMSLQGPSR